MKYTYLFIWGLFLLSACSVSESNSEAKPITHGSWDLLLKKHVSEEGGVNYKGFMADSLEFNEYLSLLSSHHPNEANWTANQQLAYWINAYNAFTIKLIVDHYPVESIKDIKRGIPFINSVFDIKFIHIEDKTYDLNNLEHGIIRAQFEEPRIHFAINCASIACPKLQRDAFMADKLEDQLEAAAIDFINDASKNTITADELELSSIFSWFRGDFGPDLVQFIQPFAKVAIEENASIRFKKYNWTLNE